MKKEFNKIILIFIIGSLIGAFYEEMLHVVKFYLNHGTFDWVTKRGLIIGPLSPIYGIGSVLIYIAFYLKKRAWYKTFLLGSVFGGIFEYLMGYLQETIWGTISWDYSDKFLNIGGRTTVPFMFFWGMLVMIFVYIIFPYLDKLYSKFKEKNINNIVNILFVVLLVDIIVTITAVTRQTLRQRGYKSLTIVGEYCDKYFTDDYLKTIYRTSKVVKKSNSK